MPSRKAFIKPLLAKKPIKHVPPLFSFHTDAFVYPYRVGVEVVPSGGGIIFPLPEPEGAVDEYVLATQRIVFPTVLT